MGFELNMDYGAADDVSGAVCNDIQAPKDYRVIFFNDDYTTMEFVVQVLMSVFHKSADEAELLMRTVHKNGSAVVGVYTYDIAATRAMLTMKQAKAHGFPLRCEVEAV